MLKKTLLVLVFVLAPSLALAHTTGFFIERTIGNYFFDIGYSTDFIAGDFVRFDFTINKAVTKEPIPFTDGWVRIAEGDKLLFAGPIAYGEFGKPGFSFVFPEAGDYTLSIRFENKLTSISEVQIPIQVKPANNAPGKGMSFEPFLFLFIGLVVGFSGAWLIKKS